MKIEEKKENRKKGRKGFKMINFLKMKIEIYNDIIFLLLEKKLNLIHIYA